MKILSLDAGGLKGIYQIKIISGLETKHHYNFSNSFDLYTGTSIGGVISVFLASKIKVSDIGNEFYNSLALSQNNILKLFKSFFEWIDYKFENKYFGEISSKVILPVYNLTKKEIMHFGSESSLNCDHILVSDIIKAICSDFRIMSPYKIGPLSNEFIDAGFYAYDPMLYMLRNQKTVSTSVVYFLSIGCGYIKNISSELDRDNYFDLMYDTIIYDQFMANVFIANILRKQNIHYYRISEGPILKDSISLLQLITKASKKVEEINLTELNAFLNL